MIDYLALALTHALILIAILRVFMRHDPGLARAIRVRRQGGGAAGAPSALLTALSVKLQLAIFA